MSNNNKAVTNKRTKERNKYRSETAYWHGLWSVLLKEVIWEGKEIDQSKVSRQTQTTTPGQKKEKRKESVIYIIHLVPCMLSKYHQSKRPDAFLMLRFLHICHTVTLERYLANGIWSFRSVDVCFHPLCQVFAQLFHNYCLVYHHKHHIQGFPWTSLT